MKSETRVCQNCHQNFLIEPEDFNFYEKIKVPPPTFCPECRSMRRLIWRNERSLHHNVCALTGKKIISMFSPDVNVVVYDRDVWWSDKWDPLVYGQDYDFSRPFFEQYKELLSRVPVASLGNTNIINSDYGNHNFDLRNCYLIYASLHAENVLYAQGVVNVKDSVDLYTVMKSENCYEGSLSAGLYNTHFSFDSDESLDSMFLANNCYNLQYCLGCVSLRNKKYCIFNEQYTKEKYEKKLAEYDFGSYKNLENFKKKYEEFILKYPRRFAGIIKSASVTGDYVMSSKNSKHVFDVYGEVENSKYITHAVKLKESYDGYGVGENAELLYEGVDLGLNASRNFFTVLNHGSMNTQYTYMCYHSQNLFGCIGIRNGDHIILNKKYSKEEYENLVPKIIEHMNEMPYVDAKGRVYKYGEFFPAEFSPFYYNETIAQEYYPLTQEKAEDFNFKWKTKERKDYKIDIKAEDLPDHINDIDESIVGMVIGCLHRGSCEEQCTEAFRIREDELKFYKNHNIALPRLCPNCRHFARLSKRNPLNLWHRTCMCDKDHSHHDGKCGAEFDTPYAPDRPEIIYCEKCYQAEVY